MVRHAARAFVGLLCVWATTLVAAQSTLQQTQQVPPPPTSHLQVLRESRPRLLSAMTPVGVPADNQPSAEKEALGKRLFFDKILSNDRTVSCATCHDPERGFADTKALAVGIAGRVGKRHSPSLINRAFGRSHFWDGRAASMGTHAVNTLTDRQDMDLRC